MLDPELYQLQACLGAPGQTLDYSVDKWISLSHTQLLFTNQVRQEFTKFRLDLDPRRCGISDSNCHFIVLIAKHIVLLLELYTTQHWLDIVIQDNILTIRNVQLSHFIYRMSILGHVHVVYSIVFCEVETKSSSFFLNNFYWYPCKRSFLHCFLSAILYFIDLRLN